VITQVEPVVRLSKVGLRYGKTVALDGIDLDIPAGRMVGFIGPDGVGKSSLFSLVAGDRAVQAGHIEVLGGDIADANHRVSVCPRIAYMPQGLGKNLYFTLSVYDNIDFFGRLFGQGPEERKRRIATLVEATGLAPFVDRPAGKLSGGMKQKLGLSCALIHTPRVLFLDEPTNGVDPVSRRDFWQLLYLFLKEGVTIFLSTAYLDEAERCNRIGLLHEGRLLACDTPARVKAQLTETILELRCDRSYEARERLKPLPLLRDVVLTGDRLHLVVDAADVAAAERAVRDRLEPAGLIIQRLAPRPPSLEDLFIAMVRGHRSAHAETPHGAGHD